LQHNNSFISVHGSDLEETAAILGDLDKFSFSILYVFRVIQLCMNIQNTPPTNVRKAPKEVVGKRPLLLLTIQTGFRLPVDNFHF